MMRLENAFKVAQNTDAMLAYWDRNLVCRFANESYIKWFGLSPQEMIDKITLPELLGALYQQNLPYINGVLKGKLQIFERDIPLPDGEIKSTIATYRPEIKKGNVIGFYVHVADISSLKKLFEEKEEEQKLVTSPSDLRLNKVEYTLKSCLFTEFPGIEILAKEHFISSTKLKHDFKKRYNQTIFNYYRTLQMQIAHKYLEENLYSKKQIASMLGFANASNFSICYKKFLAEKKISNPQRKERLRSIDEEKYIFFVKQTPAAIVMFDKNLCLLAASQKWLENYSKKNSRVEGKSIYELFPKNAHKWESKHKNCLKGRTYKDQGYVTLENGNKIWMRWEMKPWYRSNNELGGIIINTEDINEIKDQLIELKDQIKNFKKCTDYLSIGMWDKNFDILKTSWDNRIKNILELPENFEPDMIPELNFYKEGHNRDLVKKSLDDAFLKGKSFDIEVQLITARENEKTVRVVGFSRFDKGICKRIYGTFQEIKTPLAESTTIDI